MDALHGAIDAMVPEPVPLLRVRREVRETVTLHLDLSSKPGGLRFAPGQFNMLYAFGVGEVPISISGDPAKPSELLHTLRAVGAVTRALCSLGRGSALGLRGPFGSAWPLEQARGRDVVLIAGGLGLAPLRPAIYELLRQREHYRRIAILYGARTPEDLLYRKDLERWRARLDINVHVTVDRAPPDWYGHAGVVPALLSLVQFDPANTIAMTCGPEVMMRFTVRELERRGVPHQQIYLSMERNMKCAVGFCGRCQYGPNFVCKDGPVFRYDRIAWILSKREI